MVSVALATAIPAFALDDDLPPLLDALARTGVTASVVAWDDPTVSWARFDAVLLRSTWNYTERRTEFLDWCDRISHCTRLFNSPDIVRWNTDKRYLSDLAKAGAPVVVSHFLSPDQSPDALPALDEFVVKPTVGAGSRGARRFRAEELPAAQSHARSLLAEGRHVLIQPYLADVDQAGETALLFFDGKFSHAIRKGPLLRGGANATRALFAAEHITHRIPTDAEMTAARTILAALPFPRPLYARVDLLPSPDGPQLLELELTEPSLFLAYGDGAADRLMAALLERMA